jgi:hypothetical protein
MSPLRKARYFVAGMREHRFAQPNSGAHDFEGIDAYWAGYHFAFRISRPLRRLIARREVPMADRQFSTPAQWAIIIGLAIMAVAVALTLLAGVRLGIIAAWAVWG